MRPNSEPKFHQPERLIGAGRSIKAELIILISGWCLRIGLNILVKRAHRPVIRGSDCYY